MPELPEVEIVRQSLNKKIKEKKVKKVIVRNRNLRFKVPLNFENFLKNQKITKVRRFSKYLILHLSNKTYCLLHLGMSGTVHIINDLKKDNFTNASFYNSPILPRKHNHVEIIFDDLRLIYNDPRRFGYFEIFKNHILLKKKFSKFGLEPFDKRFNVKNIYSSIKKKNKNIKNLLLDQYFVSGIGNIYASEILFLCNIKPTKKTYLLNKKDCRNIVIYSRKVLLDAINKGGSSIRDFKNTSGIKGVFQKNFRVYQREKQSCKRQNCNGVIKKIIISNRSSFFCSRCQK